MSTDYSLPTEPRPNLGGEKMRLFRQRLDETQTKFGKRYGVTMNAISRYERGERYPALATAVMLERDGVCACKDWALDPTAEPAPTAGEPLHAA